MEFIKKVRVCDMDVLSQEDLITYESLVQEATLWIYKIAVFSRSLLYKGLISYYTILWYEIHVTHMKFTNKLRNLLVLMYMPQTEYWVISILKDGNDVT